MGEICSPIGAAELDREGGHWGNRGADKEENIRAGALQSPPQQ
jgi:hypothetical protein